MNRFLFTIALLLIPSLSFSAPVITDSTGFPTIVGTGFGTKSTVAPIQWDTFEGGTTGSVVSTPTIGTNWQNTLGVKYTNAITRPNSTLSSKHDFTTGTIYNQALTRNGGPWKELYISFYYLTDYGNLTAYYGDPSRNYKVVRFEGDNGTKTTNQQEGVPLIAYEKRASSTTSGIFETALRGDYSIPDGIGLFPESDLRWEHQQWNRVEFYINVNTGDKDFKLWEDMIPRHPSKTSSAWLTTYDPYMGSDNSSFNQLHFGIYFSRDGGASANLYMDDIYVSSGAGALARVEIGNSSNFANCTMREVQPAISWGTGSILITPNYGAFLPGTAAFLFVIDADGNPSVGEPIVIPASGVDTTASVIVSSNPTNGAIGVTKNISTTVVFDEAQSCPSITTNSTSTTCGTITSVVCSGTTVTTNYTGQTDGQSCTQTFSTAVENASLINLTAPLSISWTTAAAVPDTCTTVDDLCNADDCLVEWPTNFYCPERLPELPACGPAACTETCSEANLGLCTTPELAAAANLYFYDGMGRTEPEPTWTGNNLVPNPKPDTFTVVNKPDNYSSYLWANVKQHPYGVEMWDGGQIIPGYLLEAGKTYTLVYNLYAVSGEFETWYWNQLGIKIFAYETDLGTNIVTFTMPDEPITDHQLYLKFTEGSTGVVGAFALREVIQYSEPIYRTMVGGKRVISISNTPPN